MTSLCPNCGEVPCATPEACGLKILPVKEAPLSDKQIEYRVSRAASLLRGLPGPGTLMEAMRLAERLGGPKPLDTVRALAEQLGYDLVELREEPEAPAS
jgi:hypothetical protein